MLQPRTRLLLLVFATLTVALACSDGLALPSTPTPGSDLVITPLRTPTPAPESTSDAASPPTSMPAATAPEATSTPEPTAESTEVPQPIESITFQPGEIVQGGTAIVYLNEPATAATVTFGERQYPMLQDADRWWAIIGIGALSEPGLAPVTVVYEPVDGGEQVSVVASIPIVAREFTVEYIELSPDTTSQLTPEMSQNENATRAAVYAGYTTQRLWSGAFVRPSEAVISSRYGEGRSYNGGPVTSYHAGTDFAGALGDPVYAAASGTVVFTQELILRGNTIVIDHGAGVLTGYYHLSAFDVAEGDTVTAGQPIGAVGSTGLLITGPHLHWEVVIRGVEVDGELWLSGEEVAP